MRTFLKRIGGNEQGAALIELALVAPMVALMVVGIVDLSNAFSRKLALEQGAQRAIEKIMQTTEDNSVEGTLKTEAVCQVNGINAADGSCKTAPITVADVTVTWRLECIDATSRALNSQQTSTDADAFDALTCPAGNKEVRYIQIAVNDKYTPMFPIHFGTTTNDGKYALSATAGMRTQ
jgi:Flp pilus assembly protein TadG